MAGDQDMAKADEHGVGVIMIYVEHANPCTEPHVCSLVATLQDGPVDAGDQPRAQDTADEKPGEAGTQAQQHIVEEQKVVEVVERSPVVESQGLLLVICPHLWLQEEAGGNPYIPMPRPRSISSA